MNVKMSLLQLESAVIEHAIDTHWLCFCLEANVILMIDHHECHE